MNIKTTNNLTKHRNNANIKVHILDDSLMRRIGFTDRKESTWYFCKKLTNDVSFNMIIEKDGSDWEILVLDEAFLQPYDFQYILERNPKFEYALDVQEKVEDYMKYLQDNGVISGHNRYDYI